MRLKAAPLRTPALLLIFLLPALFLISYQANAEPASQSEAGEIISLAANGQDRGNSVVYSPDGSLLAVGGSSGIYLFDVISRERVMFIDTVVWARSLAFSPSGRLLAAGLFDHTVRLYDIPSGQLNRTLSGHTGWVRQVAFTPDGSTLASVSDDGSLRTWRIAGGTPMQTLTAGLLEPRTIAISPLGDLLAVGMQNGTTGIFRLDGLSLQRTLSGHTDWVRCLAFSPDGSRLASGAFDTTIRIWNVADGSPVSELLGHKASVLGIAFSPDGATLASGSVDTSVRLWRVSDGSTLQLFQGHSGFVYSVAFAPDGRTLASGGEDNTLRLWNLSTLAQAPGSALISPETPSDCRLCHHSKGLLEPPRVLEMRCDACHSTGIGINWCPFFAQSSKAEPMSYFPVSSRPAGVPVMQDGLAVALATPMNGETMYIQGNGFGLAPIGGSVDYTGAAQDVTVELRVYSGDQLANSLTTHPIPDGSFRFEGILNHGDTQPFQIQPGEKECLVCHREYGGNAQLPKGQVRIVLTATAPDGQQAADERWFIVDVSSKIPVRVHVQNAGNGEALAGAPVQAQTLLYNWRERYASGSTGEDGSLVLTLEALSEAETHYQLAVPKMVVGGVLYEGVDPLELSIPPGAGTIAEVHLSAQAVKGSITGRVFAPDGDPLSGVAVWAVPLSSGTALPGGPASQTLTAADGAYTFSGLDVTGYQVIASAAAAQNQPPTSAAVDLIQSVQAEVDLRLAEPPPITLVALDGRGKPLPFSWLSAEGEPGGMAGSPLTGEINPDLPLSGAAVRVASAPGFYARVIRLDPEDPSQSTVQLSLKIRPDTRLISWGAGQVILPAESIAELDGDEINLQRGWIWGEADGDLPLAISTRDGRIELSKARFALETSPAGDGWLYLYTGIAAVSLSGSTDPVQLSAGQMIALVENARPLPLDAALVTALRSGPGVVPAVKFEPGLAAQVTNGLSRLGIGTAKTITLIAYIMVFISIVALPLFGLYLIIRRKAGKSANISHLEN